MIPPKLQSYILEELATVHASYPGIYMVRMKTLARKYQWWPNLDKELEELVLNCHACQANQYKSQQLPLYILGVGLLEHGSKFILILLDLS